MKNVLNLFYGEPDPDRWLPLDHYPRRIIRRLLRNKPLLGGQAMVFQNLVSGLRKIGVPFRINDYEHATRHPGELACIIGKPHVLFERKWQNPVLFGAAVFSHPVDCPALFEKYPIRKILVPGEWVKRMFERYYGPRVLSWPVGIDTELWRPMNCDKPIDILIYNKKRWDNDNFDKEFTNFLRQYLKDQKILFEELRYGYYEPDELLQKVQRCKAAIFVCESETQGLAYQQMLSAGLPVFAWDRQYYWYCPGYDTANLTSQRVTSVPYWDERCGMKFKDVHEFETLFHEFFEKAKAKTFSPRDFILENLTLEKCAQAYVSIVESLD